MSAEWNWGDECWSGIGVMKLSGIGAISAEWNWGDECWSGIGVMSAEVMSAKCTHRGARDASERHLPY
eukprot:2120832-Prymnesium_polylepis.1